MQNDFETPSWKLEEEAKLLRTNLDEIHYSEARYGQVKRRLGLIALEIVSRHLEAADMDPAEQFGHARVKYFGFDAQPGGSYDRTLNIQVAAGPKPQPGPYQV